MKNYLKAISFSITNHCVCKCKHCLVNAGCEEKSFMSKGDILKICEDIKKKDILSMDKPIALTGGEVSLHPEFVEIVEGIHSIGFKKINVSMTGVGLKEEIIMKIAPYINIVSFSIDGDREYHNWFRGIDIYDKTINNIRLFKKYGVKNVAMQMSISKDNYDYIDKLIEIATELDVDHIRLFPILPIGRGKNIDNGIELLSEEEYEKLHYKIMQLNGIYSNIDITSILDRRTYLLEHSEEVYGEKCVDNLEINYDGNIYFCSMLNEEYSIGNVYEDDIDSIIKNVYKSEAFNKFNKISKELYKRIIVDGINESVCVLAERAKLIDNKIEKRLVLNTRYSLIKKDENYVIYDNSDNDILGNMSEMTKKLIDCLNNGISLENICNKFCKETGYTYEYVKRNMIKILQYLLANDILLEVDS